MSEKILMRNCQTCKNYKIGIDGICKDCTLHRAQPNYSNWEWNGIENGCEFCNGDYSLEGIYAEVEIIKGNLKISISDNIVDIDDWIKINYCPMCGRKLEEPND